MAGGPIDLGMNLTDLGLTAPSDTNAVSPESNDSVNIDELLGSNLLDAEQKARLAASKADALRATETKSVLERLGGKQGLLALAAALGVGGAVAAGGGSGLASIVGGAASATGSIGALQKAQMEEKALRDKAIEDAQAKADKAEERADKIRNRVSTMFNTNPDAFVNPETGEPTVSPRVLGWMTTGEAIPVFPQTRRIMEMRDERWKRVMDAMEKGLEVSQSPAATRQIFESMWKQSNFDAPPELTNALVTAYTNGEFENELFNTLMRYGGSTGLDAAIFAGENDLPLHDSEVLRRVIWSDPNTETQQPSQKLNQRFIDLMDKVKLWETDPANAQQIASIKASATDSAEARRVIVERALGDTTDVDFYFDKNNIPTGMSLQLLQRFYNDASDKLGLIETVRGSRTIKESLGMTDEEWNAHKASVAASGVEDLQTTNEQTQMGKEAKLLNEGALRLQNEVPGASYNWYSRAAQAAWNYALQEAEGDFTRAEQIYQAALTKTIEYTKQNK